MAHCKRHTYWRTSHTCMSRDTAALKWEEEGGGAKEAAEAAESGNPRRSIRLCTCMCKTMGAAADLGSGSVGAAGWD